MTVMYVFLIQLPLLTSNKLLDKKNTVKLIMKKNVLHILLIKLTDY